MSVNSYKEFIWLAEVFKYVSKPCEANVVNIQLFQVVRRFNGLAQSLSYLLTHIIQYKMTSSRALSSIGSNTVRTHIDYALFNTIVLKSNCQ